MIDVQTELECLPQNADSLIRRVVETALEKEGASGEVCVLVTDAEEIQRLNAGYRNIDRVTDVLTFPAWEGDAILCPPDGYLIVSAKVMYCAFFVRTESRLSVCSFSLMYTS